ncbi:1-acylglycerol-3-phosphate O-acyltransferase [Flavobacteriaceae bacterium UJ101]|nr:1-acylglycerol-3-phosphate O-acyltransferase [Flavobacteriaceae bacterium UJ101]
MLSLKFKKYHYFYGMQWIKTTLILLWKVWFLLMNVISLPFIVPTCVVLILLNQYKAFYQTERLWALFVFYTSGFYFKKEGFSQKLDPTKQYMVISNHTSVLDIMIMFILHPRNPIVFVGKSEVKYYPLLGYVFKKAHILVDRKDRNSRMQVYDEVKKKVHQGLSICIFPEGGVPDESIQLNKFKDGAFGMAIEHQLPIVIYTFGDVKKRFPFSLLRGNPGSIRVKKHPIIETKGLIKKDVNRIKEEIYTVISKQLKEFDN